MSYLAIISVKAHVGWNLFSLSFFQQEANWLQTPCQSVHTWGEYTYFCTAANTSQGGSFITLEGVRSQIQLKFSIFLKTRRHPEQERRLVHTGSLMVGSATTVILHFAASPWLYIFPLPPGQADFSFPVLSPHFLGHTLGEDRIQLVLLCPVNCENLWSCTKTLIMPPRSSAWRAADKGICEMTHFHCSGFVPLSDSAKCDLVLDRTKFKHEAPLHCNSALRERFPLPEWHRSVPLPGCDSEILLDEVAHDCQGNQGNEEHGCDVGDHSKGRHTQQGGTAQALQGSWNVLYREEKAHGIFHNMLSLKQYFIFLSPASSKILFLVYFKH